MMQVEVFDARIAVPAGMIYAGAPLSGKTTHILNLLKNRDRLFTKKFDYIFWFYGQYNETVKMLEANPQLNIKPVAGLPKNLDNYIYANKQGCHIYDDLMNEASSNKNMLDVVSRKCQHQNLFWIYAIQDFFFHGKERLSLLRCAHYYVLFKNPLDKSMIYHLANRIMPHNHKCFIDIFNEATKTPNSYLFIDGAQSTPENARFRTNIFDLVQKVYSPTCNNK